MVGRHDDGIRCLDLLSSQFDDRERNGLACQVGIGDPDIGPHGGAGLCDGRDQRLVVPIGRQWPRRPGRGEPQVAKGIGGRCVVASQTSLSSSAANIASSSMKAMLT